MTSARPADPARAKVGWNLALAVGALALALVGQFYFSNIQQNIWDGAIFFAAGIVLLLVLSRAESGGRALRDYGRWFQSVAERVRAEPVKTVLVLISFSLAYTVVRLVKAKPGNEPHWDLFALWVLSNLSFAAAYVRLPPVDLAAWWRRYRREAAVVVGLTAAAAVARLAALGTMPDVISGDEGRIGLLAQSVLNGQLLNMMATAFGHSTLYLFIMAGLMKVFGVDPGGLRLASALGGLLTVPALYLLARRMFNARVALVAAALLAVSHFHLHFSRIIVAGSIQDALFATVALYFFFTGLEERSAGRLVLSALTIGLHLHIYMGARLVILLLPAYVLCLLVVDRSLVRQNAGNLLAGLGALLVASAPMATWAYLHWDEFMARANQIGIFQSGWLAAEAERLNQSQFAILVQQFRQAFLTVNYYPAKAFYYSRLPMLDFVSGAVFMLGLAYSLWHTFDRRHLLLQGWFWSGMVIGGALVVIPGEAAYRIMIVFPAVCLFVALGWDRLVEFGSRGVASNPLRGWVVTGLFVAAVAVPNLRAYFVEYAPNCRYEDWGTRFASKMGAYLGRLGPEYVSYVLGAPKIRYGIHPSVDFLSGGNVMTNVDTPWEADSPLPVDPRLPAVFFVIPDRQSELSAIEAALPGGSRRQVYDCRELQMITYSYPGSSTP